MNDREQLKYFKSLNPTHIDFGHIFVEDQQKQNKKLISDRMLEQSTRLAHFDLYSNWYLPFDRCSLMTVSNQDEISDFIVTFTNNDENKLSSRRKFDLIIRLDNGTVTVTGEYELVNNDKWMKLTNEEVIEYCDGRSSDAVVSHPFDWREDGKNRYRSLLMFDTIVAKNSKTGYVERCNLRENVTTSWTKLWLDEDTTIAGQVVTGFNYFSNLMINTELFVVEETVAMRKKGKIITRKGTVPLYHVIDIRTIRKQYIKKENVGDDNGCQREPTERRRHTRTFRNDRFVNMKGKTIIIEPFWVGPSESYDPDKNRFYKVRLDIG